VEPGRLPQQQVDPYTEVDHTAFGAAGGMSIPELLQMAQIAESRGDTPSAMNWKGFAVERGHRDLQAESQATHERVTLNRYKSPPGRILEPKAGKKPWSDDPDLQAARDKVHTVGLKYDQAKQGSTEEFSFRTDLAQAKADATAMERELEGEYRAAGLWTGQDEVQHDAQQSMATKAAAVVAQVKKAG
jgi:hypothetical protein